MADNIARALAIQAKKGLDTETIKSTTTEWLETNGIKTGATAEQVAQIEKNTSDISQLSEEIDDKTPISAAFDSATGIITFKNLNGSELFTIDISEWSGTSKTIVSLVCNPTAINAETGTNMTDTGITVTATWDDGTTTTVTASSTFSPDTVSEGETIVTITYRGLNSMVTVTGLTPIYLSDGTKLLDTLWEQDFSENYDGLYPCYGESNGGASYITDKNVSIENGRLRLRIRKNEIGTVVDGQNVTSAKMLTGNLYNPVHSWRNCYIEIAYQLTSTEDYMWPAIWFTGASYGRGYTDINNGTAIGHEGGLEWALCGEIDLMECTDGSTNQTMVHIGTNPWHVTTYQSKKVGDSVAMDTNQHTCGMYIGDNGIDFYRDRTYYGHYDYVENDPLKYQPLCLVLNMIANPKGTMPDTFDESMYIDYIKIMGSGLNHVKLSEVSDLVTTPLTTIQPGLNCLLWENWNFPDNCSDMGTYWTIDDPDRTGSTVEMGYLKAGTEGTVTVKCYSSEDDALLATYDIAITADANNVCTGTYATSVPVSMAYGETWNLVAEGKPEWGNDANNPTWAVADSSILSIDGSTIANVNKTGVDVTTTITLTMGAYSQQFSFLCKTAKVYTIDTINAQLYQYDPNGVTLTDTAETTTWNEKGVIVSDSFGNGANQKTVSYSNVPMSTTSINKVCYRDNHLVISNTYDVEDSSRYIPIGTITDTYTVYQWTGPCTAWLEDTGVSIPSLERTFLTLGNYVRGDTSNTWKQAYHLLFNFANTKITGIRVVETGSSDSMTIDGDVVDIDNDWVDPFLAVTEVNPATGTMIVKVDIDGMIQTVGTVTVNMPEQLKYPHAYCELRNGSSWGMTLVVDGSVTEDEIKSVYNQMYGLFN